MKHRHVHKSGTAETMKTERRRFEKWLMDGVPEAKNRVAHPDKKFYLRLESASSAPFETAAKVSALSPLFMISVPNQAFLVLKALSEMADGGSKRAMDAFEGAASGWLRDEVLRKGNMRIWSQGAAMIMRTASRPAAAGLMGEIERIEKESQRNYDCELYSHLGFWKFAATQGCEVL